MANTFKLLTPEQKLTQRTSILFYLAIKGEASKSDILEDVCNMQTLYKRDRHTHKMVNLSRGQLSTTFAEMHKDGRLSYNPKTKKWTLGKAGKDFLNSNLKRNALYFLTNPIVK